MEKKAALYIRVSTHHQIDKDSLPFQRQELINYAKYALNIEQYEIFEDAGYSGGNTSRPQYQFMMDRIRSGEFTHLIVWKIDRISRNLKDFTEMYDELKECGITFVSKNEQFDTSTAMGEAMLQIILVFAELERKLTAERVTSIMLSRAEKGLWNGARMPLGFDWCEETRFPKPLSEEVEIVEHIFDLYLTVGSTLQVAASLNDGNIPTKRGGMWTGKTVRDILRNPFYIGTYRYNMRDKSDNKYAFKDESEWIVIENNHEPIIDKEVFEQANEMLSQNYKGMDSVRRKNSNIHIFGKKLFCGKCGDLLTSGLDTARKDGYQPSRYTCSSYHHRGGDAYCQNFISDIVIGPFLINYIANLIRVQDSIMDKTLTKEQLERSLLRGSLFKDVEGISDDSLKNTFLVFTNGTLDADDYESGNKDNVVSLGYEHLEREKKKYENALVRLDDLYFYDDAGMSKKDYLLKKNDILVKLESVENKLSEAIKQSASVNENIFVDKAKYFLITKELQQGRSVDFRNLVDTIGNDLLADFIDSVIEDVTVVDKQVLSIVFKNGIEHQFAHKPFKEKRLIKDNYPADGSYRVHFDTVIQHVKENGSVSRVEVEELCGIKRYSALTLLNELMLMGKLERRRESVAVRYYLK